jgi:hypothetical protein
MSNKKDLAYWKANAEEDYLKVPISVLRYISELEKRSYSEEEVISILYSFHKEDNSRVVFSLFGITKWFEQFKKK